MINQLYLCEPEFVRNVFNKIKSKSDNDDFNKFLKYFENTYLKSLDYKKWNYLSQPRFAILL